MAIGPKKRHLTVRLVKFNIIIGKVRLLVVEVRILPRSAVSNNHLSPLFRLPTAAYSDLYQFSLINYYYVLRTRTLEVQYIQVQSRALNNKCLISSHRYDLPLCIPSFNRWNILLHEKAVILPNGKLQSILCKATLAHLSTYLFELTQDLPFLDTAAGGDLRKPAVVKG